MLGEAVAPNPRDVVGLLAGIADALAQAQVDDFSAAELHELAVGVTAGIDRVRAGLAGILHWWDASGAWALDGSKSSAARLGRQTGSATRTAASQLSLARGVARLPEVDKAWQAGELSEDVVRVLVAASGGSRQPLFMRDQQVLIEACIGRRHAEAARIVRYWEARADAEVNPDGDQPVDRYARMAEPLDGAMSLTAQLDPVGGAEVQEALRRIERDLYRDDQRTGNSRTNDERMADAVVEMARRATAMPAGARRPQPLVMIVAGEDSLAHVLELSNGQLVRAADLVPHLDDALVQSFIYDGVKPLAASSQRTFSGRLRRAIQARDRHCQHPSGCDEPMMRCDVDHTIAHTNGGPTDPMNGTLQCEVHNRDSVKHNRSPELGEIRSHAPPGQTHGVAIGNIRYIHCYHVPFDEIFRGKRAG
ncbi:MAG TPA: DUF222 domain-containing protein [Ilumatobacteraceae bacterium]|nr:DUF222 domain-containing protein [Ilumatobacteraceae bacterium]